jgi:hypothetical protein
MRLWIDNLSSHVKTVGSMLEATEAGERKKFNKAVTAVKQSREAVIAAIGKHQSVRSAKVRSKKAKGRKV